MYLIENGSQCRCRGLIKNVGQAGAAKSGFYSRSLSGFEKSVYKELKNRYEGSRFFDFIICSGRFAD